MDDNDESAPIPFGAYEEQFDADPTTIEAINARFERGSQRMLRLEQELRRNTDATKSNGDLLEINTKLTSEMYEVFAAAKSGIQAIAKFGRGLAIAGSWLVKAVKVLAPLAVGLGAIWHALGTLIGHTPTK